MPTQSLSHELKSERYKPVEINLENKNSSQSLTVELVGENKRVLEIGTSTGYVTKVLMERGNRVIGVEIDKDAGEAARQYCESMIIGDIDELDLDAYVYPASIDVILMADVLEHLRWPGRLLGKIKNYLKKDGYLVVSLPNVAHGDLLFNLLNGDFRYTSMGLLDETHLRFFGRRNIINIFNNFGYKIEVLLETKIPVGSTELSMDSGKIPNELMKLISSLPDSDVYQFVFKATLSPSDNSPNEAIPDVDFNKAVNISLEDILEQHESEKASVSLQLKQARDLAAALGQNISQLQKDIEDRDSQITSISSQLQQAKTEKVDQIASLGSQLQEAKSQMLTMEQANAGHEAQIASLGSQLLEAKSQMLTMEQANTEREVQIASLGSQLQEAKSQMLALEKAKTGRETQIASLGSQLQEAKSHVQTLDNEIAEMKRSIVWQMTMKFHKDFVERALPNSSMRRRWYDLGLKSGRTLVNEGLDGFWLKYNDYKKEQESQRPDCESGIQKNKENIKGLKQPKPESTSFEYKPKISIIMPVWNTDERWLKAAIESVLVQIYDNWEMCIADGGSTNQGTKTVLEEFVMRDKRIKVKYMDRNEGISINSNEALSLATGDFIGFLDHDDELTHEALFENIKLLNEHLDADVIYSDHAKKDECGNIYNEEFKPDWSPELLLSYCYIGHFKLIRRSILEQVGLFNREYDGAQDYDLLLRIAEKTDRIFHIPKILYLWRATDQSIAKTTSSKPASLDAGRRAVYSAMRRRDIPCEVIIPDFALKNRLGIYKINFKFKDFEKVNIIIPTKDNTEKLKKCVDSIERMTTYKNYEIMIIDNGSSNKNTLEYLETLRNNKRKVITCLTDKFNFSKIINQGIAMSDSEFVILLNDDTEIFTPNWIEELIGWLEYDDKIGAVGCKLIYEDKRIQHAGVVLGLCGHLADHAFKLNHYMDGGYLNYSNVVRNYSAVTAACLITKKGVFDKAGKFDEKNLPISFNDVDYCLNLRSMGYRVVYTPHAILYHHEGSSRGKGPNTDSVKELASFKSKYEYRIYNDEYYNKNLSLANHNFTFKSNDRILFISHNLNMEGAPIFLYTLAKHLINKGFPICVVSVSDGQLRIELERNGIDVMVSDPSEIIKVTDKYKPKIIIVNTIINYAYLDQIKALSSKIIWIIHESERNHYFEELINLSKEHFEIPSEVIFVSDCTRDAYIDLNKKNNFKTIHNGLDLEEIDEFIKSHDKATLRRELGFPENAIIISTVGTVCERKDQETFIKAASEICRRNEDARDFIFILVGARKEVPYYNNMFKLISSLQLENNIKIVFSEDIPRRSEVLDYYLISDIYVCTSQVEAFPITILEAMAFSLPIISTDVFGIKEQITDNKEGIIFRIKDYHDLSNKIESLIGDPRHRSVLGKNARIKLNENFTLEKMSYYYEECINELLHISRCGG